MGFISRLSHAWNAFVNNKDPTNNSFTLGHSSNYYPDRVMLSRGNERIILNAVLTRIAIDVSSINIRHVRIDDNDRYAQDVDSKLNNCLSLEANKDQTARSFFRDVVLSMFDEGVIAIVPTDTTANPTNSNAYDIYQMRVAQILEWFPDHVRVRIYDGDSGKKLERIFPKTMVAIIENPMYSVMNGPNSTLQRLISKLRILDKVDEQHGSGKLDLIFQLPYVVKSETKQAQAERRKKALEDQLANSPYGIAYTDATEKVIQLNRSVENNIMPEIEYLTKMLFNQLGMTEEVFNGTADESAMLNYNNRTIEPILSAITDEMKRKFLSKTARSQGQSIMFFRDPFRLVPVSQMAEIADKFTRNEILSSNEVRALMGFKPSDDPKADELRNKNIQANDAEMMDEQFMPQVITEGEDPNEPITYNLPPLS